MSKVIAGATMSLDGFINDRNGDVSRLYPNLAELREAEGLQEAMESTGAVVMGRHSYNMGQGDFTNYEYQVPIFVITHNVPETVAKGQNDKLTITFVTDGVESAIEKAKAAAGDKDVMIVGGANVAQQCIKAGLVDELQMAIMPVFLGEGMRFFEHLDVERIKLETSRVIQSPGGRTDIYFRIVK